MINTPSGSRQGEGKGQHDCAEAVQARDYRRPFREVVAQECNPFVAAQNRERFKGGRI
jgi:hypothetical protein